jgi:gliding motility-associated-like protein
VKFVFSISLLFLTVAHAVGQNDYYMSNAKVSDCKGNFFDSDNANGSDDYDHNENYIFTICVPGAQSITLTFTSFCTEADLDYLILYDGKDTTASKLGGKLSGSSTPGSYTTTDSCLTIYFHSDASKYCDGWEAAWTTKVIPLLPPKIIPPTVSCEDTKLGIRLDQKWNCDSISSSNFTVTGPINPSVTLTPINCDANNETDTFVLNVSPMLDRSGRYVIEFDAVKYDRCDSAWVLHSDTTFDITNCPIYVNLIADPDTICTGTCTEITAEVTGGDSSLYVFNWSTGISGTFGPHTYCPTASGWVYLTVSDGISIPGSDSIWIEVVNPPIARTDTTVCEAANAFNLTATPIGGFWTGNGIINPSTGLFDPPTAGAGLHTEIYHFAGCTDTVLINVIAFDAGPPNASCPGLSSFTVTGFNPSGGIWSGPNIDSTGLFNPSDTGTYTVTYTWNGCVDTKTINVYPVYTQEFDTVCQSTDSLKLNFSPIGGTWSGPGFLDYLNGWFLPPRAGWGNKTLIYNANGCRDTTQVYVKQISARWNQILCPDAGNGFTYAGLAAGGYWDGVGIVDSITGEYDPSFVYGLGRTSYNDTLRYYVNGCVDEKIMYVRKTIVYNDTLKFCIEDPRLLLNWTSTRRTPGGGRWSGAGISGNYFTPILAGRGIHKLYYDAYGCRDSITMIVHPQSNIQNDTLLCETDLPITLFAELSGGSWVGSGVTNPSLGWFDPSIAGIGLHKMLYYSKFGCIDSCEITVSARPVARISQIDPIYCFTDTTIIISGTPFGGTWTGTTFGDSLFNPVISGTGNYKIGYRFGTATCFTRDSVWVEVLDTLKGGLAYDDDSLCYGEESTLIASGLRGGSSNYAYNWSASTSKDRNIFIRPPNTQWVHVTISDGCSEPYSDSLFIHVFPKIEVDAITSDTQCYGTVGFAELTPRLTDPYALTWYTTPPRFTNRISAQVSTTYDFRVQNLLTKCLLDSGIYIPSYPRINAHFITTPTEGICLNPFDPVLQIINYTIGATQGTWYFGDSSEQVYNTDENPSHYYKTDTNRYVIWLYVENRGGCKDSFSVNVCVDDSVYVVIPNAFSPGVDGINDLYHVRTAGVTDFYMAVFNRWGEKVFETNDKDFEWDGSYLGKPMQMGVYPYYIKYKGKKTVRQQTQGTIQIIR